MENEVLNDEIAALKTTEAAGRLIDESAATNQTIHAAYTEELAEALGLEADDMADTAEAMDFWGAREDGEEWRVHLDR